MSTPAPAVGSSSDEEQLARDLRRSPRIPSSAKKKQRKTQELMEGLHSAKGATVTSCWVSYCHVASLHEISDDEEEKKPSGGINGDDLLPKNFVRRSLFMNESGNARQQRLTEFVTSE